MLKELRKMLEAKIVMEQAEMVGKPFMELGHQKLMNTGKLSKLIMLIEV